MTHTQKREWKKKYKKSMHNYAKKLKKNENEPWVTARRREKAVWYARKHSPNKAAVKFGVTPRTIYRWLERYVKKGIEGLLPKSKRPKNPRKISDEIKRKVIVIRKIFGIGCEKIAIDIGISPTTVNNILKEAGLHNGKNKRKMVFKHFEREHSNTLWHLDFSELKDKLYLLLVIDDHSRFILGYKTMKTPNVEDVLNLLEKLFSRYGVPREIITDHGSQFYAVRGGVSTFDIYCLEREIKHILAGVRHPQTNGKVERKFRTVKEYLEGKYGLELKELDKDTILQGLEDFVEYHNYSRIHFTYQYWRFGDVKVRKKVYFIPYLRFVTHRV